MKEVLWAFRDAVEKNGFILLSLGDPVVIILGKDQCAIVTQEGTHRLATARFCTPHRKWEIQLECRRGRGFYATICLQPEPVPV